MLKKDLDPSWTFMPSKNYSKFNKKKTFTLPFILFPCLEGA